MLLAKRSLLLSSRVQSRFSASASPPRRAFDEDEVEEEEAANPFLTARAKRDLERRPLPAVPPKKKRFEAEPLPRATKWITNPENQKDRPLRLVDDMNKEKEEHKADDVIEKNVCAGCGAKIQTDEPKRLGYIPPEKLNGPIIDIPASLNNEALRAILAYKPSASPEAQVKCQRCWKLEHYGVVVPVEVTAAQLLQELKHIRTKKALIIKIIDVFDFDGTFVSGFSRFSGANPVILLVNKIDLLPADVSLERVEKWVRSEAKMRGLDPKDVFLVSGFTGLNLKRVASAIHDLRQDRDVFVMGQSNVGKSTIVNKIWPILNPNSQKKLPKATVSPVPGTTLSSVGLPFNDGFKFYDTPGIMPEDGLSRAIPLEDYIRVLPKRRFKPRIVGLKRGNSLFLGGFARIDFISGPTFANLSIFGVPELELEQAPIEEADELFDKHISEPIMAPFKNREGQSLIRKPRARLEAKTTLKIDCSEGYNRASADIVFAGLGWVAVAANARVEMRCWYLPGCAVSERPPMMPYEMGKKPY